MLLNVDMLKNPVAMLVLVLCFLVTNQPIKKKSVHVVCSLLILTLILLIISPVLLTTSRASSSTCASVYTGDVVYITEVVGFLYNKATITVKPPVETEVEVDIFYIDDANSQWEESNHSSQVNDYIFPQGILVQNNTESYFLSHSEIDFCFQVQANSSELAKFAKICQFSNVNDYNALTVDANTNKSIAKAEKRGDCQEILKPPNKFKIKHQGYYWYALSIPSLHTEILQASYTYHLNKRYYNQTMLGDSYDCSVDDSDCVIGGLIGQRSTKHLLVYIPIPDGIIESTDPYEFCVEMSSAWGIVIVVFIPVLLIALFCFTALLFVRWHLYR